MKKTIASFLTIIIIQSGLMTAPVKGDATQDLLASRDLILHYDFNNPESALDRHVPDVSDNENHGVIVGTEGSGSSEKDIYLSSHFWRHTYPASGSGMGIGVAYEKDGNHYTASRQGNNNQTDAHINMPSNIIEGVEEFSIAGWIYPHELGFNWSPVFNIATTEIVGDSFPENEAYMTLYQRGGDVSYFQFRIKDKATPLTGNGSTDSFISIAPIMEAGKGWNHFGVTLKPLQGTTRETSGPYEVKIYINGELVGAKQINLKLADFDQTPLNTVGGLGSTIQKNNNQKMKASYDDFRIYSEAITPEEMRLLHNPTGQNLSLTSLTLDGTEIEGFEPDKSHYTVTWPTETMPEILATAQGAGATATIAGPFTNPSAEQMHDTPGLNYYIVQVRPDDVSLKGQGIKRDIKILINNQPEPIDGIVLRYDFERATSDTDKNVPDVSGNGKHGTVIGDSGQGTIGTSNFWRSPFTSGLQIAGPSEKHGAYYTQAKAGETNLNPQAYIQMPENVLSGVNAFTVSGWIWVHNNNQNWTPIFNICNSTSADGAFMALFQKSDLEAFQFRIKDSSSEPISGGTDYPSYVTITPKIERTMWNHFAVTLEPHEGTTRTGLGPYNLTIYLNGEIVGAKEVSLKLSEFDTTAVNTIGKGVESVQNINAKASFDEFRIYSKALTHAEIQEFYNPNQVDLSLKTILINGEPLAGFDPAVTRYTISPEAGAVAPLINAIPNDPENTVVFNANAMNPGTQLLDGERGVLYYRIQVRQKDLALDKGGLQREYKLEFRETLEDKRANWSMNFFVAKEKVEPGQGIPTHLAIRNNRITDTEANGFCSFIGIFDERDRFVGLSPISNPENGLKNDVNLYQSYTHTITAPQAEGRYRLKAYLYDSLNEVKPLIDSITQYVTVEAQTAQ